MGAMSDGAVACVQVGDVPFGGDHGFSLIAGGGSKDCSTITASGMGRKRLLRFHRAS